MRPTNEDMRQLKRQLGIVGWCLLALVAFCIVCHVLCGCTYTHETTASRTQLAVFSETSRDCYGETQRPSAEAVKAEGIAVAGWCKSALMAAAIAVPGMVDMLRGTSDNLTTATKGN